MLYRLKGYSVVANSYSDALEIKNTVLNSMKLAIKCSMPETYTINGYSVKADSIEQAKAIYKSMRECVVNSTVKRVNPDNLKAYDLRLDNNGNFITCESLSNNAYWDKITEQEQEQDKTVINTETDNTYNNLNCGSLFNNIASASDYINAYNDYLKELKETDIQAWENETGLSSNNDSVFGSLVEYDFNYHFDRKVDSDLIRHINTLTGEQYYKAVCDYIANTGTYEFIAKALVKSLASNVKADSMNACLQIVNNYFREPIFDDIKQDIYIALHNMVYNDFISIDYKTGKLIFETYETESGETRSHYLILYRVIRNTLLSFKNGTVQDKEKILSECTNVSDIIDYCIDDRLNKILNTESFKGFIHWLSIKDSKNFKDMVKVISALLTGKQLNNINGMSKDRANYIKNSKLKQYHAEYYGMPTTRTVEHIKYDRVSVITESEPIPGLDNTYLKSKAIKREYKDIPHKTKKGKITTMKYNYIYYRGNAYKPASRLNSNYVEYMVKKYKGRALKRQTMISYPVKPEQNVSFSYKIEYSTIKDRKTHVAYMPEKVTWKRNRKWQSDRIVNRFYA